MDIKEEVEHFTNTALFSRNKTFLKKDVEFICPECVTKKTSESPVSM